MFDSLTKSRFYSKCKSSTRMTKTRLEALKKKKKTVVKYLKNDVADLLKTGLNYNAYGRAEGLLAELNVLACYEFIERFCGCILSNLTAMDKQKECPDACKEAVHSLVYAAARFAEFPELRNLRSLFSQRYETPSSCSSTRRKLQEPFVENSKVQAPSKEEKVQLMRAVAKELSVQWSSNAIEKKLFQPQAKEDERKSTDCNIFNESHIRNDHIYNLKNLRNKNREEPESCPWKDSANRKHNFPSSSEDETTASRYTRGSTSSDSSLASSSSLGISDNEEDAERKIPYRYLPPPYQKPKAEKQETKKVEVLDKVTENVATMAGETKPKPRSVRSRPAKPVLSDSNDEIVRPLKPPPGWEYVNRPLTPSPLLQKVDSAKSPSLLRRFTAWKKEDHTLHRKGFRDQRDEEKVLDGLLMHYSKKGSPSPQPQVHCPSDRRGEPLRGSRKSGLAFSNSRAVSTERATTATSHTRSLSMQPVVSAGHVHPNLPDYDDLAARLGSLKGR